MKFRLSWAVLGFATIMKAHFVFVVPLPGGANAQVFLSENLKPDAKVDLGLVAQAQLSLRDPNGREAPLVLVNSGHAYAASLPGTGTRLIHGTADLGVMQQGTDKSYLLTYYPKAILGDPFDSTTTVGNSARVEVVPVGKPGAVRLELLVRGVPESGAEITVIRPDASQVKVMTDHAGLTEPLGQSGRYGAWASHWEAGKGMHQGKAYDERRDYATLVFDTSPQSETAKGAARIDRKAREESGGPTQDSHCA